MKDVEISLKNRIAENSKERSFARIAIYGNPFGTNIFAMNSLAPNLARVLGPDTLNIPAIMT